MSQGVECYSCLPKTAWPPTSGPDIVRIDRLKLFLDSMGSGAWPFLVGGVICLVNSDNERDLSILISYINLWIFHGFLEGLSVCSRWKFEAITGL